MVYLTDRELYPLQMFLKEILIQSEIAASMIAEGGLSADEIMALKEQTETMDMIKYCVIVAASLPMMIIYPRLQKYFVKGVMIGSVKG